MEISKLGLNRFYGHSAIIKNYCGYPEELPLPLVIQHGGSGYYNLFEVTNEYLFDYWVWDEAVKEMNVKKQHLPPQTIHVLGSPFIYLADEVKPSLPVSERKGTIAFPNHSTPCNPAIKDFQEYASQLEELPDDFHPISVCLHPYDISQGLHIPFQEKGFTVISCVPDVLTYYEDIVKNPALFWQLYAQSYSPFYLTNFIKYCTDKKYATSNFSSTPTYYSIYLGLEFFWYGNKTQYAGGEYSKCPPEDIEYYQQIETTLSLTDKGQVPDWDTQWKIASTRLGVKHKMGKDELLSYLKNLYQARPYVEGLRHKFTLLAETEAQVQNLQAQLQESSVQIQEVKTQLQSIESENKHLKSQLNQVKTLTEICEFQLKNSQLKSDEYYAFLSKTRNELGKLQSLLDVSSELDLGLDSQVLEQLLSNYKDSLEKDSGNPLHYYQLGKIWMQANCFENAISCYRNAILLDNNQPSFYSELAEALIQLGELNEAVSYYRHAIHLKRSLTKNQHLIP